MRRISRTATALVAIALVAAACGGSEEPAATPAPAPAAPAPAPAPEQEPLPAGDLVGAGATFVNPIFVDWIFEYTNERNPDANINYQSIGSGGGIRQFHEQTVDFGASERYLRPEQLQRARADRGCDAIQAQLAEMSQKAREVCRTAIRALVAVDAALARTVGSADDGVDSLELGIFERLVTQASGDVRRLPWAAQMIGLSRRIERYADHGVDIAEQVVFAATGVMIELSSNDLV